MINPKKDFSPLISIIVPCYNQAIYLDECLNSVIGQTYNNWECIIVNDGSPDNTEEVAKVWCQKDNRIKYLDKINGGLSSARNAGINLAKGSWILPLDADDKICPRYIELATPYFCNSNNIIYGKAEKFGVESGLWNLPEFDLVQFARYNLIYCSSFFAKDQWEKHGGYDENMKNGWEDWEFWIKLINSGCSVIKLDHVCFYYRIKQHSMLLDIDKGVASNNYKYLENKHYDFFAKYLGTIHDNFSNVIMLKSMKKNQRINFWYRVIVKIKSLFNHN